MTTRPVITIATEGTLDIVVVRRLLAEAGLQSGAEYVKNGKGGLDRQLAGYNSAARFSPWLVLRDLDHDAPCPPALRRSLLPEPARHMRFHVAVRSIEAWLLADSAAFSQFFAVPPARIPSRPENEDHPKRTLIALAGKSRRRTIREGLVPAPTTTAAVGPGYTVLLAQFAQEAWDPEAASRHSSSLARLRQFLRRLSSSSSQRLS